MAPTLTTPEAIADGRQDHAGGAHRGQGVMRYFHSELLHFDRYATLSKLGVPSYNESLNAEYEESSYLFFDKIFTEGLGVKEILTSTKGFVGPGMAEPLRPDAERAARMVEQDLGPDRVGFFSQLPYLTLNALNEESDSIHRGVTHQPRHAVRAARRAGPQHPAGPAARARADQPSNASTRLHLRLRRHVPQPASINPVGFAFEHFDGMGQYRDDGERQVWRSTASGSSRVLRRHQDVRRTPAS